MGMRCQPILISHWKYTSIKGVKILLAQTYCEIEQGLQNVSSKDFPFSTVMLFFGIPPKSFFHTRNCKFPIEISFLDSRNKILDTHTVVPEKENIGPTPASTRYALESNVGWLASQNLKIGDTISWLVLPKD